MSNTQLVEAIYDFAEHQRLVLGRSEATIKGYTSDLLALAKTIDSFSSFNLPRLRNWLAAAVAEGKARSTLARRTASVKAFSTWAVKQGYLRTDEAAKLSSPKVPKHLPKVLDPKAASAAMDNAKSADELHLVRDTAMLELLYATGMRVSELTEIGRASCRERGEMRGGGGGGQKKRENDKMSEIHALPLRIDKK